MKVNYFGYYLKHNITGKKVLFDLRNFFKAYCSFDNATFKNEFKHHDENLYFLHYFGDTFLFLITRSHEIIKKINTSNISIGEIKTLLEQNEQLGFASYVLLKEDNFSFGCTLLAPKVDVFSTYINNIFKAIGLLEWVFIPQALLYQATKEEALSFSHIGRTTIELSKQNSLVQDILASISADTSDTLDLEGIEILIKPKLRKNIKPTVEKFLNSISDNGIEKMVIKAKSDGASQMMDLYLVGKGAISDSVDKSKETLIPKLLEEKMSGNRYLSQKIEEYRADENFEEYSINGIVQYFDLSSWTDLLPNIQQDCNIRSELLNESSSSEG